MIVALTLVYLLTSICRTRPGHRLDAARAGGDRGFGHDPETADGARMRHVGAATQFLGVIPHGQRTDLVPVLLAEQRHETLAPGRVHGAEPGDDRRRLHDLAVDRVLGRSDLGVGELLTVGEVETQALVIDGRAGLVDVFAELVPQRGVEQVGRRVRR